jgi:hypothetical protein
MVNPIPTSANTSKSNPFLTDGETALLTWIMDITKTFANRTQWDKIIPATNANVTAIVFDPKTPISTFSWQDGSVEPSASWASIGEAFYTLMYNKESIATPSKNNLMKADTQNAYMETLENLCLRVARMKISGRFGADTFFSSALKQIDTSISMTQGVDSYKSFDTFILEVNSYIANVKNFPTLSTTADNSDLKYLIVCFRPYFVALYIKKLIRTMEDIAQVNKPKSFFLQAVCIVVFHLYIIQTCMVLSQMAPQKSDARSQLNQIINFQIARIVSILDMDSTSYNNFYTNLNTMITDNKNNAISLQNTSINLEFEKSNLEKAVNLDVSTAKEVTYTYWRLYAWIGLLIILIVVCAIMLFLCYMGKANAEKAAMYALVSHGVAVASMLATVIYLIVVAVRST